MIRLTLGTCAALSLFCLPSWASAELALPEASPRARVIQQVGLTEIEVEYSSPATRGRKVWGELVPYNTHWRTGANVNTLIHFSRPIEFGGTQVEAGTYSLHTIPGEVTWTVIVNRKTDGYGSPTYDASQDVVRTQVQVRKAPSRERLTFLFSDSDDASTHLDLEWAGVRIRVPIRAATTQHADAAIEQRMSGLWREPARAAAYLVDNDRELKRALELAELSIGLTPHYYNYWIKARVLAALGKKGEAIEMAKKALTFNDNSAGYDFYSKEMKAALETWEAS